MDIKEFKAIVEIMKRADLSEFEIAEEGGFKLRIKRSTGNETPPPFVATGGPTAYQIPPGATPPPFPINFSAIEPGSSAASSASSESREDDAQVTYVKSPMVGTFYRAPSPDSQAFANVGDVVTEESVVGIIEAMKVMNEIQAEVSGKIIEILVDNGKSVEYGQPLFKLKKP